MPARVPSRDAASGSWSSGSTASAVRSAIELAQVPPEPERHQVGGQVDRLLGPLAQRPERGRRPGPATTTGGYGRRRRVDRLQRGHHLLQHRAQRRQRGGQARAVQAGRQLPGPAQVVLVAPHPAAVPAEQRGGQVGPGQRPGQRRSPAVRHRRQQVDGVAQVVGAAGVHVPGEHRDAEVQPDPVRLDALGGSGPVEASVEAAAQDGHGLVQVLGGLPDAQHVGQQQLGRCPVRVRLRRERARRAHQLDALVQIGPPVGAAEPPEQRDRQPGRRRQPGRLPRPGPGELGTRPRDQLVGPVARDLVEQAHRAPARTVAPGLPYTVYASQLGSPSSAIARRAASEAAPSGSPRSTSAA
jgi:hypothetical protein